MTPMTQGLLTASYAGRGQSGDLLVTYHHSRFPGSNGYGIPT